MLSTVSGHRSAPRLLNTLWPAMGENGVSDVYIQEVNTFYCGMSRVNVRSHICDEIQVTKDLEQGYAITLSPQNMYNASSRIWRPKCKNIGFLVGDDKLHFADDQVI